MFLRLSTLLCLLQASIAGAQPTLEPPRREGPIVVNGRLSEGSWQAAEWSDGFTERVPTTGATPPVRTRFRVLYDEDALYVGVEAELLPGEVPRAAEMTRDNTRIFSDDAITVKVDVRHDRRTTLGFGVNPNGQQIDYVAIDNGRVFRRELDSVWEVATEVRRDAWTAEFRIPVTALGLRRESGDRIVGFNITRDHNVRRATYDWAALPVEFGAFSALHYGELRGLDGMAGGRPLALIPYVTAGWREDDESRPPGGTPWTVLGGGEARLRLGEDTWGEITVLTDFAQVDLDDPLVNLDRFPLFFPERRPFFLSGLSIFDFGASGQAQPFFTRRIGLDENRAEIPMLFGAKTYGQFRLGEDTRLSFGVLDVLTGGDLYGDAPLTNDGVLRLRLNFGRASYVGALATLHTVRGTGGDATAGADFSLRVAQERLQIDGFVAGSFDDPDPDEERRRGAAGRLAMQWRGRVWRPSASLLWVDEDFDPAIGFVRRRGLLRADATIRAQHRTRRYGLETVDVYLRGTQELEEDGSRNLGRNVNAELALGWVAGMFLYGRVDYQEDVRREPGARAGRAGPAGESRAPRFLMGLSRSSARNPSFSIDYLGQSGYFGGVRQTISTSLGVVASRYLRLGLGGDASFIKLPNHAPFEAFGGSVSATIAPTTTLQLDAVWQVNTIREVTVGLVRLRWRFVPGSDIFVVYRESRPYGDAEEDPDRALERRLLLKISYRYDALL